MAQRAGLAGQTALGGQLGGHLAAGTLSGALSGVGPAESLRFTRTLHGELEVNDYPQQARFKVMNKEVLSGIQEFTKPPSSPRAPTTRRGATRRRESASSTSSLRPSPRPT